MTGNQSCVHFLTIVQWLKKRDEETFKHYSKPTETWHSNMLDRQRWTIYSYTSPAHKVKICVCI